MASTTTSQNYRLSPEVLGIIFSYYRSNETPEFPLETILLVCKSWNTAALRYRALWSCLNLYVQHEDTTDALYRHAKRRLQRSGTALIDIELLNLLAIEASPVAFEAGYNDDLAPYTDPCRFYDPMGDSSSPYFRVCKENGYAMTCSCLSKAYECACDILTLLAGPGGELCEKWRSLTFYPSYGIRNDFDERRIAEALSYPTPNLVSLTLQHITLKSKFIPFLPCTPPLLQLALDNCYISSLPDTSKLRFAGISWETNARQSPPQNLPDLYFSTQIQKLYLGLPSGFDVTLPDALPNLQELQLSGEHIPDTMLTMNMGRLNRLTILVESMELLSQLTGCASHDLWRVTELGLCYCDQQQPDHPEFEILLHQLLTQCNSLNILRGDRTMLGVVIKLLWEQTPAEDTNGNRGHVSSHLGSARIFGGREIELRRMFDEVPLQRLGSAASRQDLGVMAVVLHAVHPEKDWNMTFEPPYEPEATEED